MMYVINVEYVSASCDAGTNVQMTIRIIFDACLPLVIETTLKNAIESNTGILSTTRTYTLIFLGGCNIIVVNKMHSKSNEDNTTNMISELIIIVGARISRVG